MASILGAMRATADNRERVRAMNEMMYSSARLRDRLTAKHEGMRFSTAEDVDVPAFLRRKTMQGKVGE